MIINSSNAIMKLLLRLWKFNSQEMKGKINYQSHYWRERVWSWRWWSKMIGLNRFQAKSKSLSIRYSYRSFYRVWQIVPRRLLAFKSDVSWVQLASTCWISKLRRSWCWSSSKWRMQNHKAWKYKEGDIFWYWCGHEIINLLNSDKRGQ